MFFVHVGFSKQGGRRKYRIPTHDKDIGRCAAHDLPSAERVLNPVRATVLQCGDIYADFRLEDDRIFHIVRPRGS